MTEDVNKISVRKRNGTLEPLNISKIHKMVGLACEHISGVSISDIVMKAHLSFFDGISSVDIHRSLTNAAADLISEKSPNYQYVAGRLLSFDNRKTAWGSMNPPRLYDHIVKMVNKDYYTPELLEMYTEAEWDKIDSFIDHDRDLDMTHIGVSEYLTKYSIRDRSLNEVTPLETPQITYILIAAVLCASEKSLKAVKSYYNDISNWNISLPTPIMAGVRTKTRQFSSCVLIESGDSLDEIISTSGAIVKYASKRAGIGIEASAIRAEGSSVSNGEVRHTGVIPFYRMFESSLKSCSQGGVRGASATLYTALWHFEIEDILVLKNNKGTPDTRVRKLDYGVQINNYLYNRFINGQNITLFSPSEKETPGLREAFFADQDKFIELYEKYEKDPKIRKKSVSSVELFTKLVMERKDTGRIYIFNVDNVNSHSPFNEAIKMSNLCCEILLLTNPLKNLTDEDGRIALCTLSAINLGNVRSLDDLEKIMYNAVSKLDNLLDYQDYMLPAARESTLDYRPLGIGIVNLAYYLAKNNLKFSDKQALQFLHDTYEAIAFYALKASMELAKQKGPCRLYHKTKYAAGILPIDHYNKNVDKLVPPNYKLDWEWLREEIRKYGVRNATLLANMPAECNKWSNTVATKEYGNVNFHEICDIFGLKWQNIENDGVPCKFNINLDVYSENGVETSTVLRYNGYQDLYKITFEDGSVYSFTPNHKLKIIEKGNPEWHFVGDLDDGDAVITPTGTLKITKVDIDAPDHAWELEVPGSNTYLLGNMCLSHNSSAKIMNATNGQEAVRALITTKGNKSNISKQVVPEINRLRNKYELLWDMPNMDGVINTSAVMQKFVCQSLSTNLSYNPANYENNEIPLSVLVGDILKANYYGLKTLYYSNINDQRDVDMIEKVVENVPETKQTEEEVCDSCTI